MGYRGSKSVTGKKLIQRISQKLVTVKEQRVDGSYIGGRNLQC
jgi:hypothetical protein